MTGAIASVKSEDLTRTSVGSVANILGGQMTGLTTVQYSGEPGSDAADIFIRGKATWSDAAPLIQVDGVERGMNDIDPNEIEYNHFEGCFGYSRIWCAWCQWGNIDYYQEREGRKSQDIIHYFCKYSSTDKIGRAS